MDDLTRCIILIVMLLLSAFFALSESALSYCNQIKLKLKADEGNKSAKYVLKMLNKFDKYIVTVLICTNVAHILTSVIATILCVDVLSKNMNIELANQYGAILSTIATTLVVFLFGEMIPKTIAKARADASACICIYPMMVLDFILTPISLIFMGLIKIIKRIFHTKDDEPLITEDDFQDIIDNIEHDGQIEAEESDIIQSAVEFDDLKVKEVMCSRENICALNISNDLSHEQLIDFIVDNNFSRIPVYKDTIDNIIGILHTRILLKVLMNHQSYTIEKLLVKPLYVKPNVHLDTIFDEFKKNKTHIAVVKDKENKTLGIVTMEDVLEELVGDIDESNEGGVINE